MSCVSATKETKDTTNSAIAAVWLNFTLDVVGLLADIYRILKMGRRVQGTGRMKAECSDTIRQFARPIPVSVSRDARASGNWSVNFAVNSFA